MEAESKAKEPTETKRTTDLSNIGSKAKKPTETKRTTRLKAFMFRLTELSRRECIEPVDRMISSGVEKKLMKTRMERMITRMKNQIEAMSLKKDLTFDVQYSREDLTNCISYCFLFPSDREFDKDTMVQLWVAEEIFVSKVGGRSREFLGSLAFDIMVEDKFILPCRFDNIYCHLSYRLNQAAHLQHQDRGDYLMVEEINLGRVSKWVEHLSLICGTLDLPTSEVLKSFKHLKALILIPVQGFSINHLPGDVFLHLKELRILDLHGFEILNLPVTVGNLKSLRYLDVSETRIKYLPESICSLNLLETLKLKGCSEFDRLPKGTKDLISLRHLDLDIVGQLKAMPSRIGGLTELQTLRAFLVGKEKDGCDVGELKKLDNLSGSFRISRLENVLNAEEARGAKLNNKKHLTKLEFEWSGHCHNQEEEEDILEGLQPHFGIQELEILFFHGSKLPTWISNPSFIGITSIHLFKCTNCSQLPSLGRLPSLEYLEIYEMNAIKVINNIFCGNDVNQEHCAFPKLEKLTLDVMLNLEEWIGVDDGDFPRLLELRLKHCPKLVSLPWLSHLNSLKYLEIIECTEFQDLPDKGIPHSVQTMIIKDCPRAKDRCSSSDGQDWYKIKHIPSVFLDYEQILPNKQPT